MGDTRPLGAQISHMLKARGVDTIFGIPGVHNVEMYRGVEEAGITHVLARHEQGAGFMADGYARATGKPGVAYVITGPGLCNVMTPMGQAYSDSVPMLVISSCLDETEARRGQLHQMLDQQGAAACVCDWSAEARSAEAAYGLIDRAFEEFETVRPRTKHIQVGIERLSEPAPPAPARPVHRRPAAVPDPTVVAEVADLVASAMAPLFIFGGGLQGHDALVRDVLERTGAASFVTYAGRGLTGVAHPMCHGATLVNAASADVIGRADLVVVLGASLDQVDLWREHLGHKSPLVRIDLDPEVLADRQRADIRVRADAASFLSGLLDHFSGAASRKWDAEDIARFRLAARAATDAARPGLVAICDILANALPADAMVYSDMTQMAYVAKEVWPMPASGHWHHPTGFGTLGYALPAAIGGAVARRGQPTVAIAGDYGFQYTVQELGTAVELGLSLPVILWDNGKLKEIEDAMIRSQIPPNAVVARNPDFCALASAYGARSEEPIGITAINAALDRAFTAPVPTLIRLTSGSLG